MNQPRASRLELARATKDLIILNRRDSTKRLWRKLDKYHRQMIRAGVRFDMKHPHPDLRLNRRDDKEQK